MDGRDYFAECRSLLDQASRDLDECIRMARDMNADLDSIGKSLNRLLWWLLAVVAGAGAAVVVAFAFLLAIVD